MSISQLLEEKYGLNIDTFNADERATYFTMLESVQKAQMTPEKLRDHIIAMRDAVEKQLIEEPEFVRWGPFKFENRRQILLKARLQNYMLLEGFLVSPKRAEEQLEAMIANFAKKG